MHQAISELTGYCTWKLPPQSLRLQYCTHCFGSAPACFGSAMNFCFSFLYDLTVLPPVFQKKERKKVVRLAGARQLSRAPIDELRRVESAREGHLLPDPIFAWPQALIKSIRIRVCFCCWFSPFRKWSSELKKAIWRCTFAIAIENWRSEQFSVMNSVELLPK